MKLLIIIAIAESTMVANRSVIPKGAKSSITTITPKVATAETSHDGASLPLIRSAGFTGRLSRLMIELPSWPMLIEENIKGTNNGMKAARKKPDARPLISPGLARIGARKDTEITTGIAMNLARSFRLVSALNSFIARSDDKELKLK